MTNTDNLSDNEVAFASLQLFGNKPHGTAPDWQEIFDWHSGLLDDARAREVLSHVANNPECFQQWQDICEAEQYAEQASTESAQDTTHSPTSAGRDTASRDATRDHRKNSERPAPWDLVGRLRQLTRTLGSKPLPALGGAVAATLLAILVVPKIMSPVNNNVDDMLGASFAQYRAMGVPLPQTAPPARTTRSMAGVLGDIGNDDIDALHVQYGLRSAFEELQTSDAVAWRPWLESLPDTRVDCTLAENTERCENNANHLELFGKWTLLNTLACQNAALIPAEFWHQQAQTHNVLTNQKPAAVSVPGNGQTSIANNADAVCTAAESIMNKVSE